MPICVLLVANTIIYHAIKEGIKITPMKLNKLIWLWDTAYFVEVEGASHLFTEEYVIWKTGPIYPTVQMMWGSYGGRGTRKLIKQKDGTIYIINVEDNSAAAATFRTVWNTYKGYKGAELVEVIKEIMGEVRKQQEKQEKQIEFNDSVNNDYMGGFNE